MRAGKLRHSVILQSPTGSRDSYGERTTTWTSVATVWASIEPLSAKEVFAAAQMQGDVTHKVYVRYDSAITAIDHTWRVLFGSRALAITGVRNIEERSRTFELLCSEGMVSE